MKEKMKSKHAPRKRTDNTRRERQLKRDSKAAPIEEEETTEDE
jgi:hypothetical protein